MWRKIFFSLILAVSLLLPATTNASESSKISIFTSTNCKHCQDLAEFLEERDLSAEYYDLGDKDNLELFNQFTNKYELAKVTPIILIGDEILEGFDRPETTGKKIEELLAQDPPDNTFADFMDKFDRIEHSAKADSCDVNEICIIDDEETLTLPWVGEINPKDYSMPVLTVILGFIDGFNPCAMWVLIMFITIILQAGDRRKMWELVGIFLIAEAIMYYLILNFWYKTWNFVQLDTYITPIIGVVSVGAGIFFLWEFFTNKDGECKVVDDKTRQSTISRIKEIATSPLTISTFFATILLALSINVIEFACSIGIPQAFTKILDINEYGFLARQLYIGIYTLMYMVDDFLVFGIALYSISKLALTTKYTRYCQLIGGLIMLILGYFLMFDPTVLKF